MITHGAPFESSRRQHRAALHGGALPRGTHRMRHTLVLVRPTAAAGLRPRPLSSILVPRPPPSDAAVTTLESAAALPHGATLQLRPAAALRVA